MSTEWFMLDYDLGGRVLADARWYGLKRGDGVVRGVPEGTRTEWQALIAGLRGRSPDIRVSNRLAWSPEDGVYSPRNTNPGEFVFTGLSRLDLADLIEQLIATAVDWTPDGKKP